MQGRLIRQISRGKTSGGPSPAEAGFTLVELLIVIGIIALLIGFLLPALSHARQVAQRTSCAAKLHAIMLGAAVHRADHRDFYPLVGVLTGGQPEELDDADSRKYDYRSGNSFNPWAPLIVRPIAPITVALSSEMSYAPNMLANQSQTDSLTTDARGLSRNFLCPSQCATIDEWLALEPNYVAMTVVHFTGSATTSAYTNATEVPSSYIFNEFVLGFDDFYGRLRGHASQVRHPESTFFVCDGLPSSASDTLRTDAYNLGFGVFSLYNNFSDAVPAQSGHNYLTLADCNQEQLYRGFPIAAGLTSFDIKRHQKNINIAFCDGHVETREINSADLARIYLMPP